MTDKSVLIVDDEEGIRESLSGIFEDEGFSVLTAATAQEGLRIVTGQSPDIVFLDICLPDMDGIDILTRIHERDETLPVVMITGHGSIELAVKATKAGAYDFLEKPLSLEKVLLVAARALERSSLENQNRELRKSLEDKWTLVGKSEKISRLKKQIETAARSGSRVLLLGESGTGKELAARLMHSMSPRLRAPFIEMNCAAIPQELIESELFGHEKGAFTGASERKTGKFELAHEGMLFLDEIGDMSLATQAKVLRVIEMQVFQRVGGSRDIRVDVRIIAATNKDVVEEVRKGNFREDLFFRLNVIPITVPPLRERKDDIPLLIGHFMNHFCAENGMSRKTLTPGAEALFQDYDWPGNIRELRNAVERILIMAPAPVVSDTDILSLGIIGALGTVQENDCFSHRTLDEARKAFETEYIIRKLREFDGNVSKTAQAIDVERSNLHKKIKLYGIREQDGTLS